MDQPGSGDHVIGPPLIIDNSAKRPNWSRQLDWILSALMWLLYLYLMRTAFVDLYYIARDGIEWAWSGDERPFLPAMFWFLATLADYGLVILASGAILILWATYNWLRFHGLDRRGGGNSVTAADLAALYKRSVEEIESWQNTRILVMFHDPDGTLVGVDEKGQGPAQATEPDLSTPKAAGRPG